MNIASADPSWWADWLKFTPGWLAFVVTLITGIRKSLNRFHRKALGADDDKLREQLTSTRGLFEEITTRGGLTSSWFLDAERRETARRLRELAERRDDKRLKAALSKVADAWDWAFAAAPPDRWWQSIDLGGHPTTPEERAEEAADQKRCGQQVEVARSGLEEVATARDRLNKLERRNIGRS
ncbi:hypothetical protein OH768_00890 [Streptomyces sp. NBC_01622]|uniref:hypothetical protein n=1 Tax=Streptomyces sp. NBC_01622 TaxID=2975903 RepID=UPI0038696C17|nr:hypothetical protein OH768_00890 [Streptomyces sp. NBC_01622]